MRFSRNSGGHVMVEDFNDGRVYYVDEPFKQSGGG